jgi:CRISPR-associated protein Csb1
MPPASLRPLLSSEETLVAVIDTLCQALSDQATTGRPAGIEIRQDLAAPYGQPVMPPSYEGELEIHPRHFDGQVRPVIELDSIGSSANRVEEGLLDELRSGRYPLPVSSTTIDAGDGQRFMISTLEAPHRIFDAWIRLATEAGSDVAFQATERGQELSLAHAGALDPILEASAHDLLFGVWDSHRSGPGGQVRIARSFTSTVIGLDPQEIVTTAARRDPLNLGEAKDVKAAKGMKLSEQGLSSIPPQRRRPGVSISEALFIGFLSFAALRRLRFERYDNADVRVLLAALCVHGLRLRETAGWHLRSECDLFPISDMRFELVRTGGEQREQLALTLDESRALLTEAAARAGVENRSVHLVGGPHLTPLVERALEAGRSAKSG